MFSVTLIAIILKLLVYNKISAEEIQCPSYCKCDIFEKYRRTICQNQSLISVEADIPIQVQLLDVSNNLIHEIHDHIFHDLNLTSLKLLNLSHNKINRIHINAFYNMDYVISIDLSYNYIEYLLEHWFWNIHTLKELYLQGNNLRKLKEGPLLESTSLKVCIEWTVLFESFAKENAIQIIILQVLDLSRCSLPHIHEDAFSKLPSLEILDLSNNNMIQLNFYVIKPLSTLKILKIENNTWHCNNIIQTLTKYCIDKGIICTKICAIQTEGQKSERMILETNLDIEEHKNSWIYEDLEKPPPNTTCIKSTNNINKDLLLQIIELSPIIALLVSFFFGLALGIIACEMVHATQLLPRKENPIQDQMIDNLPLLETDSYNPNNSTPITQRRLVQFKTI